MECSLDGSWHYKLQKICRQCVNYAELAFRKLECQKYLAAISSCLTDHLCCGIQYHGSWQFIRHIYYSTLTTVAREMHSSMSACLSVCLNHNSKRMISKSSNLYREWPWDILQGVWFLGQKVKVTNCKNILKWPNGRCEFASLINAHHLVYNMFYVVWASYGYPSWINFISCDLSWVLRLWDESIIFH